MLSKPTPARPEFIDEMRDGLDVSEPECPAYWRMRRRFAGTGSQSLRKGLMSSPPRRV